MKTVKEMSSLLQTLPVMKTSAQFLTSSGTLSYDEAIHKIGLQFDISNLHAACRMMLAACWSGCLRACVAGGAFVPPAAHVRRSVSPLLPRLGGPKKQQ